MSTSHCYLQNTIFNLSLWLNCLIDVIGKKKWTGCRVFWRAFLFTLRFIVQFLLRENPMQHCWINIYFRKTLWRRSDLVGTPPTQATPTWHNTSEFLKRQIVFFQIMFVIAVYWRFPIYISLPGSPNNHYLHFEGLSPQMCVSYWYTTSFPLDALGRMSQSWIWKSCLGMPKVSINPPKGKHFFIILEWNQNRHNSSSGNAPLQRGGG